MRCIWRSVSKTPAGIVCLLLVLGMPASAGSLAQVDERESPRQQAQEGALERLAEELRRGQEQVEWALLVGEDIDGTPGHLLNKFHRVGQRVIQAGQLAWEKGSTWKVREYGERLVRDHRMAHGIVAGLAADEGIEVSFETDEEAGRPEAPGAAREERAGAGFQVPGSQLERLEGLSGEEFDREFLDLMEKVHANAITMLARAVEQEGERAEERQVRETLKDLVPLLWQHYKLALLLEQKPAEQPEERAG